MGMKETKEAVQQLANIYEPLKNGVALLEELAAIDAHSEELRTEHERLLAQRDEMKEELDTLTAGLADVKEQAEKIITDAKAQGEAEYSKIVTKAVVDADKITADAKATADKLQQDAEDASGALLDLKSQKKATQEELDTLTGQLAAAKEQVKKLLNT